MQVTWHAWKTKREKIADGSSTRIVTKTVKEQAQGTRKVLAEEIITELQRVCRHIFNIRNQYKVLHHLKNDLKDDEVVAHIDFSENYTCKYAEEIQSMHFGGSRRLLSLHTGVLYTNEGPTSFCSVSDCLRHDPAGIWGHMHPVLNYIQTQQKRTVIHFISDGPTTQYRNKNNFYLWGRTLSECGFKASTWNFLESAHGKGAADGVGAAVKRAADDHVVVKKNDITCAKDFIGLLGQQQNTKVKLFLVDETAIQALDKQIPEKLRPIPSTMKIHQVRFKQITNYCKNYYFK